jgi:hypothetical protein
MYCTTVVLPVVVSSLAQPKYNRKRICFWLAVFVVVSPCQRLLTAWLPGFTDGCLTLPETTSRVVAWFYLWLSHLARDY